MLSKMHKEPEENDKSSSDNSSSSDDRARDYNSDNDRRRGRVADGDSDDNSSDNNRGRRGRNRRSISKSSRDNDYSDDERVVDSKRYRDDSEERYKKNRSKGSDVIMPGLNGPLLSYKAFMDMQENPINMADAEKYYSKYKDAYERKQCEIFFQIHKDEHWFREKYDPQLLFKFKNDQMKQSQTLAKRFFESLDRNEFEGICLEFQENFEDIKQTEKEGNFEKKGIHDDEEVSGPPYFGFDANKTTLYLKLIPIHISRWDLLDAVKPTPGFLGLSMSEPLKTQDFVRYAWVTYDTDENCQRSKTILEKVSLKDFDLNPVISVSTTRKKVKVTPLLNQIDLI